MGNKASKAAATGNASTANKKDPMEKPEPIGCAEVREVFQSLLEDDKNVVAISAAAERLSQYYHNDKIEKMISTYSANKQTFTEQEFLEAFTNFYSRHRSAFSRERSASLEEIEYARPPPELRKPPKHSKLSPNDRIATPIGPDDRGEHSCSLFGLYASV
uniref:DNA endonuclease activator Ctp1 C-terminal domain-containing protein n=1 Tax=Vannella robusta TaxID=1487602 RepID=A0A7S4HUW5_9EUKA|mmetsp:Transcript_15935/g.20307  ORF Transcript_15935/g.20307 Transcript_15935/m.20307 type:complete len:160 (+) Transcript_15935:31-510(+)